MKNFIVELLREGLIDEAFTGKPLPFNYTGYENSDYLTYEFTVPNKDGDYTIVASVAINRYDDDKIIEMSNHLGIPTYEHGAYLVVSFKSKEYGYDTINRGDIFSIINTIKAIVKNAVDIARKKGLALIMIYSMPISSKGKDTRKKLYDYLYRDLTSKGTFELFEYGAYSGVYSTVRPRKPRVTKKKEEPKVAVSTTTTTDNSVNQGLVDRSDIAYRTLRPSIPSRVTTENETIKKINKFMADDNIFMHTSIKQSDGRPSTLDGYEFNYIVNTEFLDFEGSRTLVMFRDYYPNNEETAQFVKDNKDEFINLIQD